MNVRFVRQELSRLLFIYSVIRACIAGPAAIREGGEKFLPKPNPEDTSEENKLRYDSYLTRARFYGVTFRTWAGFVGQIFYRDPVYKLPALLKPLELSVDGGELTLVQQSKEAVGEVLSLGRAGLLTDYPVVTLPEGQKSVTLADQQSGKVRPTILLYKTEQIINWRWSVIGAKRLLTMLVLQEEYDVEDDGFEVTKAIQWRVFRMEGPILRAIIYRESKNGYEMVSDFYPKKGNGQSWDRIPFSPIGSENNDPMPDKPPMEDLAHLNIGHYRNSADYEEACFITGQPTPWASGLTEDWVKDVMKGTMMLGSRGIIPLPVNGACGLLQAAPNTMPKEAMEMKERQMITLGAKIAETTAVQQTATESSIESVVDNSTLSSVAKNTSAAYTQALADAAEYANTTEIPEFELNTDFEISKLSAQERQQLLAEWQGGAISWEEYRYNIKRAGVAYQDDTVAKNQIQSEMKNDFNLDVDMGKTLPAGEKVDGKDNPPKDS